MTRQYAARPVWTWSCDRCGREVHLAREQNHLPTPDEMREQGWIITPVFGDPQFGDICPKCVVAACWCDRQGGVWTVGADGLMHSPETAPFPREHVEKKWGPLVPASSTGSKP